MDLTKLSDADLMALRSGDLSKVSTEGLVAMRGQPVEQPQQQQRLNNVQPPNWIERQLAKMPDLVSSKTESQMRGFVMGGADPSVGTFQLGANALGLGQGVNQAIAEKEAQYQQSRQAAGREGLDVSRLAGNVAITAPAPVAKLGALKTGAILGAANPVTEGDFSEEKIKQTLLGAVGGKAGAYLVKGAAKVLSPASAAIVKKLREEGISPTIGQALGGIPSKIEEKAMSLPLVGDFISAARQKAQDQFNRATINKALAPIGEKTDEIGQAGIKAAGDKLSSAFDKAIAAVKSVKLDSKFGSKLDELKQLTSGLDPAFQAKFKKVLSDKFLGKVSKSGGLEGTNFQNIYSELGKEANRFASQLSTSARDYANSVKQLQSLLQETAERTSNPEAQTALKAAREGWANLIRIEKAGTAAKSTEGVFTPGQLLAAVRSSDSSVRDRATARGTAFMQDWATAAQNRLGNKVPDSGTAGRVGWGLAGAAGLADPILTGSTLLAGSAAYTPAAQKALVSAAIDRPEIARKLAELLRNNPGTLVAPSAFAAQSVNQ